MRKNIARSLLIFIAAFSFPVLLNAQTANTSPLPAGETVIGGHLHAGAGNEVWTDANVLYFNYRGLASTTHFWNLGGGTGKPILSLLNSGYVGVGTSSPAFNLDVQGFASRLKNISTSYGSYTSFRVQGPDYTHGLELDFFGNNNITSDINWSYGGGAGSAVLVNVNPKPLVFGTNNLGRVLIDGAGNVGVGTFSPAYKFHLSAVDQSVQQRFQRTGSSTGITDVGADDQGFKFFIGGYGTQTLKVLYGSNGKVGIGTFSPDAELTVNGVVHSKEVKVDLSIPAPDYVFEKGYKLKSLEDIKNYIDQNKHLPEVPSANEIEKDGIQLGEMNMILLKKIEEMTLYMIDAKKEIEAMKIENQEIRKLINK